MKGVGGYNIPHPLFTFRNENQVFIYYFVWILEEEQIMLDKFNSNKQNRSFLYSQQFHKYQYWVYHFDICKFFFM